MKAVLPLDGLPWTPKSFQRWKETIRDTGSKGVVLMTALATEQ